MLCFIYPVSYLIHNVYGQLCRHATSGYAAIKTERESALSMGYPHADSISVDKMVFLHRGTISHGLIDSRERLYMAKL